jgi:hypothetical protein
MAEKLTDNTDETQILQLFESQSIYEVPFFQRPYKWKKKKLERFEGDLVRLADMGDLSDLHFFGAIIIQGTLPSPTAARRYQVIDGQQRLTTLFLYVLAAIKTLVEIGEVVEAGNLFEKYIVVKNGKLFTIKLHPSGEDRKCMNDVIKEVLDFRNFRESLPWLRYVPLEIGSAESSGTISSNFKIAKKFYAEQVRECESDGEMRVATLYTALLLGITIVQINVKSVLSGPKIFDSLNSNQEPMTVGELVRNDIFSRAMTDSAEIVQELHRESWEPFYTRFGPSEQGLFDSYFFPFGLIDIDPNIQKAAVYMELRKRWSEDALNPKEIIAELARYQYDFLDFHFDGNLCNHETDVAKIIGDLRRLGTPSSIFSFLMKISYECRTGNLSASVAAELYRAIESFLVRRGAFGLEPSGLHAAFKGLWSELKRDMDNERITDDAEMVTLMIKRIGNRSTVKWPSSDEFIHSLKSRGMYGSRVTPYILSEYNKSLGDDGVGGGFHIEHVLPQNMSEAWTSVFNKEEHSKLVNKIGNLTLLSENMNIDISNGAYALKMVKFSDESRYKMSRDLADQYPEWTPDSIERRSSEIAVWAASRWAIG